MKLRMISTLTVTGIFLMGFYSLKSDAQTVKDMSGNVYKTVNYGLQVWASTNLNTTRFRNGEVIPEAKTPEEWKAAGINRKPVWCHFNNDPENGKKYGKLYNWYAINDPRGLAPKGWHVPKNADWSKLVKNLTGINIAGTKLKSTTGWKSNTGTNLIGFSAGPGGYRSPDGKFDAIGILGQWWSNSVPVEIKKSNQIYSVVLKDGIPDVRYIQVKKPAGLSVRFIKD